MFSENALALSFDAKTLARARGYCDAHRVLRVERGADGRSLVGVVRGTHPVPYDVIVRAGANGRGVRSACTCPVAENCKHGAAVALWELRGQAPARKPPAHDAADGAVDSWIATLDEAARSAVRAQPSSVRYVIVHRETYYVPRIEITAFVAPELRGGDLGKARKLDLATLSASSAQYVARVDRSIARLLYAGGATWPSLAIPAPPVLGAALELAIETGRLYWETLASAPLRARALSAATLDWLEGEDGRWRLRLATLPDAVLLPSAPLWYVDPRDGTAGPVALDVPAELLPELAGAPALTARQAERAHVTWRRVLPQIAAPPAGSPIEVVDLPPVPRLQLHAGEFPTARLRFAYGDDEVGRHDRTDEFRSVRQGTSVVVPRRLDLEAAAVARLGAAGLMAVGYPWSERSTVMRDAFRFAAGDERAWVRFLDRVVPELEAAGWDVQVADDFPIRIHAAHGWESAVRDDVNGWFALDLGITVDGTRVSLLPILLAALSDAPRDNAVRREPLYVPLENGSYVAIAPERVAAVLDVLDDVLAAESLAPDGALRLAPVQSGALAQLDALGTIRWEGAERVRALARGFDMARGAAELRLPRGFVGALRGYQRAGVAWLQALRGAGFGAVLADDMGLGKTVQLLAHLAIERAAGRLGRPVLIVAPTSVVPNWRAEIATFTPELRVVVLTGAERFARLAEIDAADVVLTSYALLQRDAHVFLERDWSLAVLDEAQFVKNPRSKGSQTVRRLSAAQRIALTGTPVENHLDELWSIFAFAVPGLLGESAAFSRHFRTPIERHGSTGRRDALVARTRPFMLRRTKDAVALDLPPKTEMVQRVELEGEQRDLYETIRLAMHARVREAIERRGFARSRIVVLDALLKLRQVCCDPRLLKSAPERAPTPSAKLAALFDMLPDLIADGRRVVLFSQFTSMLDLIVPELRARALDFVELRGSTRDRETPVARFQRGEVPLFLVSLKAGGTGLNLTAADTVIHYDPWWNPAVERQATDRAHRIGQTRPVFVYRLVTMGTVEERILEMQARKAELAESLFADPSGPVDPAAIERLFAR